MKPILSAILIAKCISVEPSKVIDRMYLAKFRCKGMMCGEIYKEAEMRFSMDEVNIVPTVGEESICHVAYIIIKNEILLGQLNKIRRIE